MLEQLAASGLDRGRTEDIQRQKRQIVVDMVKNTLSAKLDISGGDFKLKDIKPADCRAEMQFDFALKDWDKAEEPNRITHIYEVLKEHWGEKEKYKMFLEALEGR